MRTFQVRQCRELKCQLLRFFIGVSRNEVATKENLILSRFPPMFGGLGSVMRNNLGNVRQGCKGQSQTMSLAGRKRSRLKAVARRIQWRMGTLNHARPDRDGLIAVVLALPGERLRVGQCPGDQKRGLLCHSTCLIQIDGEST